MAFHYLDIELAVRTVTRESNFKVAFTTGLNVIQAPNSWGKSTLIQSLVFGLGLEGAFSTSHLSPLGEAMSSVIDLGGQREAVVESSVTLTIQNDDGAVLRTRRFAQSLTHKSELIQTWSATSNGELESAMQVDLYVRQSGGATHELGFHRLLEEFIGLELPSVPGFKGDDVKLYLEVLLPLFYVEQKYGWSGLAPRVPTHYRVRSPYRRAAEYVLGLTSLERLKAREELKNKLAGLKEETSVVTDELEQRVASQGWVLSKANIMPTSAADIDSDVEVGTRTTGEWRSASNVLDEMRHELIRLSSFEVRAAGARTDEARDELVRAESELVRLSGRYRADGETLTSIRDEVRALESSLEDLRANREMLVDVRKLERLGSELHSSSLGSAHCPTCAQNLDAGSVATGIVMDVAANIELLAAEKTTLDRLIVGAQRRMQLAQAANEAARDDINGLRARVRSLKDELSGPSNAPSVAQIEERLALAERIRSADVDLARAYSLIETLKSRALSMHRAQQRLRELGAEEESGSDKALVGRFRSLFAKALERFELRSLPASEVTIGADSLLPEQGGFELTFDIQHGLSASDAIRTKWAHYIAMAEASAESATGHPLGILILDEPRQQEAEIESVKALYAELARISSGVQVIVASSASDSELEKLTAGLNLSLEKANSPHMFELS